MPAADILDSDLADVLMDGDAAQVVVASKPEIESALVAEGLGDRIGLT